MPVLKNPKHELFAQLRAKQLCADKAYVQAGYKQDRSAAARLSAKVHILDRIAEISQKVEAKFVMSRVEWLESFRRIAVKAEEAEDYAAARGCLREIGLALPGWYAPEKQEHDGKVEIILRRL